MTIIVTIIILIVVAYIITILRYHSINLPNLDLNKLKQQGVRNILFIYPHPDDETIISGGFINKVVNDSDFNIFVVDITKGDRGDELLKLPPEELAKVREIEYHKSLTQLGVKTPEMWGFLDSTIGENEPKLKSEIQEYVKKNQINLIVTYERWGIYGHKDHVALSKVVNEVVQEDKNLKVLYSTITPKMAELLNLKSLVKGLQLADFEHNEYPELKLPIFSLLLTKYRALKNYKSQNLSHKYPLWVTILMNPYEYYTTKFKSE